MAVLFGTDPLFLDHDAGTHHPERPERLGAVLKGIELVQDKVEVVRFNPEPASGFQMAKVHGGDYLATLRRFCLMGGGELDPDTQVSIHSWDAAILAAGAGIDAAKRLKKGQADAAFVAVRPPGHHAIADSAMGFCLINNVAVLAAELVSWGERVLIFDFDAHHGNGTQDAFFANSSVLYVSTHQYPLFPGTGRVQEVGIGDGHGTTVNIPLPEGTTGPTMRYALETIAWPAIEAFDPTWLLISAGFDAHYKDPLTEMGLSSGDFFDLTSWAMKLVPKGRTVALLEGGYDLEALRDSTASLLGALSGESFSPEAPGRLRPERDLIDALAQMRSRALD